MKLIIFLTECVNLNTIQINASVSIVKLINYEA